MFKGSIVALITPLKNNQIDLPTLGDLIEWHIAEGTNGLVICGSTGEGTTLSADQHTQVLTHAVSVGKGRIPLIASVNAMRTEDAVAQAQRAEKLGFDGLMVITPPYVKPTQDALSVFFKMVHDMTTLPIILYNNPSRTGGALTNETIAMLARRARIVGIKDATGDITRPAALRALIGPDFIQLCGEDGLTLPFLAQGGHGGISVMGNVAPALCARLHTAWQEGNIQAVQRIADQLHPLTVALFCETSPAPVKYAVSCLGRSSGEVLAPLLPASPCARTLIDQVMVPFKADTPDLRAGHG